jgi:hypothetical protein
MLTIELNDLLADGFALEMLGFDPKELNALLEPEVIEGLTDEDAVPDVPEEPKTKLGDIYQLGNHRLMCGDSCSQEAIEKLTGGAGVDMLLTDPPYNVAVQGGNHANPERTNGLKIINDKMPDEEFRQFL